MGSCVKKSEFVHQCLAKLQGPFGKILHMLSSFDVVLIAIGLSDFDHDFSLPSLYDKIRKDKLTNMQHPVARCLPTINLLATIFGHLLGGIFSKTSSKGIKKPDHKRFISGSNSYKGLKMFVSVLPVSAEITDVEGSFSIHNSSHVCGLSDRVFFSDVFRAPRYINSFINVYMLIYNRKEIKCTAAETNPDGTVNGEVIVRASWKHEEVSRNDLLAA
jgi:hypothetical protein